VRNITFFQRRKSLFRIAQNMSRTPRKNATSPITDYAHLAGKIVQLAVGRLTALQKNSPAALIAFPAPGAQILI
jgi:hypothetical protein